MSVHSIQWGDFPTWLLVAVTLFTVISAGRILGIERDRDQKQYETARQSQASHVSAWSVPKSERPDNPRMNIWFVDANVFNGSNQPIYKIHVNWYHGDKIVHTHIADLVPPGGEYSFRLTDNIFCEILGKDLNQIEFTSDNAHKVAENLRIELSFTDSGSVEWLRLRDGLLTAVKQPTTTVIQRLRNRYIIPGGK